jgi:hypothetical protein
VSSPLKLRKTSCLIPCGWAVVKVEGVDGDGDIILFCGETVEETRVKTLVVREVWRERTEVTQGKKILNQ